MQELQERITRDGVVRDGNVLKVGSFLNHQLDVRLLDHMGAAWAEHFADCNVTKLLTIEASGIALATAAARHFAYAPVVFAKKTASKNLDGSCYTAEAHSYTHGTTHTIMVEQHYLDSHDNVLIIDDFLARGEALRALLAICDQAQAKVVGIGIAIEKAYQGGSDELRARGLDLCSLARIGAMDTQTGTVHFL